MKLLLDTNALIWWMADNPRLGQRTRAMLADPGHTVVASIVSVWEITMKWRTGKFPAAGSVYIDFLRDEQVEMIGLTADHLHALEALPAHHKDPFDHLIIAQTEVEDAILVTSDREMTLYGIRCIAAMR